MREYEVTADARRVFAVTLNEEAAGGRRLKVEDGTSLSLRLAPKEILTLSLEFGDT